MNQLEGIEMPLQDMGPLLKIMFIHMSLSLSLSSSLSFSLSYISLLMLIILIIIQLEGIEMPVQDMGLTLKIIILHMSLPLIIIIKN